MTTAIAIKWNCERCGRAAARLSDGVPICAKHPRCLPILKARIKLPAGKRQEIDEHSLEIAAKIDEMALNTIGMFEPRVDDPIAVITTTPTQEQFKELFDRLPLTNWFRQPEMFVGFVEGEYGWLE